MSVWFAGLAAAAVVAGQAPAAPPEALEDPEANLVEEVVVTARLPGPAWWRVSDGDSTVHILGLPEGPIPPGVTWDRSVLQRRLRGATVFIDQPSVQVSLRGAPALLRLRARFRSETPLERRVSPALMTRFVAARQRLGQPASRYAGWSPLVAGERLASDAEDRPGWTEPDDEVRSLAKQAGVRRVAPSVNGLSFLQAATGSITPALEEQCFRGALDDVEAATGPGAAEPARAWAEGRVAGAVTAPRSFNRCLLLLSGGSRIWREGTRAHADAVAGALSRPGHAVAVVSLRRLLAEDGVLQTLRGRGLTVAGPAAPEV